MVEELINIKNLRFSYGSTQVLDDVDLTVNKGDFLGLVGENGSGKSTLIKLIAGFEDRYEGTIKVFDKDIKASKNKGNIGFVPQKANAFNTDFPATVEEIVGSNVYNGIALPWQNGAEKRERVKRSLELVGMQEYSKNKIGRLSGGQQQRIFIARALAGSPEILLMDEPTVGVDAKSQEAIYCLLARLNQRLGITIVMVTHDIAAVTWHANKLAMLSDGRIRMLDPDSSSDREFISSEYGYIFDPNSVRHNCSSCDKWGETF